jgi:hypothetical protein
MMSERAIQFLESWLRDNLQSRMGEPETVAWECFADALKAGIAKEEIREAAGGSLTALIRQAIRRNDTQRER